MSIAKSIRKLVPLLGLLILAAMSSDLAAQTRPLRADAGSDPVASILWVGNSFFYYNNSMHGHYNELAKAGDPGGTHRGVSVTISGSGLDWHDVASYLQPDAIGKYSFAPGNRIVFNKPGRQFDAVIMMDCSQCPIHPQLAGAFRDTVKKDAAIVAKYGARPRRSRRSRRSATSTPPGSMPSSRPSCRRWRRKRCASTTAASVLSRFVRPTGTP